MTVRLLRNNFIAIIILLLASCNDNSSSDESSKADSTATKHIVTTLVAPIKIIAPELQQFQDSVDASLKEINLAEEMITDSVSNITDHVAKREFLKAKLNLNYLANSLARAKINYLVNEIEPLNNNLSTQINSAQNSFKKITSIAIILSKINKGLVFLVALGKTIIAKGLA